MRFEVEHVTTYEYTSEVTLEPHVLRLRPRSDPLQRLLRFHLEVDPPPVGLTDFVDGDGNSVTNAWFEGTTRRLEVRTAFEVETLRTNPYDFVLYPLDQARVPLTYPADMREVLHPYTEGTGSPDVAAFAAETAAKAGQETLPFLEALTHRLHRELRYAARREGDPRPPAEVLASRAGPCRDFTVLFMDACRAQGLAARFVSGYAEGAPGGSDRELHAWPEVYLAGAGWRGFDPTAGLAVADRHVAVAAGRMPQDAAPLKGTFRSDGAAGTLRHRIGMRVVP